MKKTTLLGVATVIMIVLNCILLFILYAKPRSIDQALHRPEPKQVIIDKLQFSPEQITQYEVLIKGHRQNIDTYDLQIRDTKAQLYNLLSKNEKQTEKDSLIGVINGYQKEIEYVHFKHFKDIKMLCTTEQKILFEQLVPELPKLFGPKPPMGPPGMHGAPDDNAGHRP
jgi:periplasmic protein CpxP/Spy